jgi:hypothetical protein
MNLVRLKLRASSPFWFYGPINLTQDDPISDIVDLDDVPKEFRRVLELSARPDGPVKILPEDLFTGGAIVVNGEDLVDTDDEVDDIKSVTVDNDEEKEQEAVVLEYDDEALERAEIFLKKNGNVVKAAIRNLGNANNDVKFLLACQEVEPKNKNRSGIMKSIDEGIALRVK